MMFPIIWCLLKTLELDGFQVQCSFSLKRWDVRVIEITDTAQTLLASSHTKYGTVIWPKFHKVSATRENQGVTVLSGAFYKEQGI